MTAEVFLDSNVLIYAAAGGEQERLKRERSLELIQSSHFGTSAQVLQEFYVNAVKKPQRPISTAEAMQWIDQWLFFPCLPVDHRLVCAAIAMSARYRISYWDAAILAAAEALGAHTVYSEDLNSGQRYGAVRVVNPFV